MKKLSLILICVIAALYVMAEDRFYINDFSINPGETKQVEIMLDNTTVFTALQADIYLPQGLTIEQEDGDFLFDLTSRKGRDHTISSRQLSSGAIRILVASQNLKTFSGNSGALVTFNIIADQSISGNKVIELKNVTASEVNQTEHHLPNTSCNVTVTPATVLATGISLNKTELSLQVGAAETLVATVTPSNVTNGNVTWSSSNTAIATVSSSGKVTAKAAGSAVITAKTADGTNLTATCQLTVTPVTVLATGISLNKNELSLEVGATETLVATVTPSNVTNGNVTWSSSNTAIATVSSSGKVTAKAAGSAVITAKTADGTNLTATCQLTVNSSVVIGDFDFMVDGIAYNINSEGTSVTVTYTDKTNTYANNYPGLVTANIPAQVIHSGETYTVVSIAEHAFRNCKTLESVIIPATVTSIGTYAFAGCEALESMVVKAGNAVYDSRNSCNAIIEKASNRLIAGCKTTEIPNTVTTIGAFAFYEHHGLETIEIPSSVTKLERSAFNHILGLKRIVVPNSVVTLEPYVFSQCYGLEEVTIGSGVTSMGQGLLYGCSAVTSLTSCIMNPNTVTMGTNVFKNMDYDNCVLYVPEGTKSIYQEADQWKDFLNIKDTPYSFIHDGIAYKINSDNETLTITYTDNSNTYANNYPGLVTANIPAQVTHSGATYTVVAIAEHAFRNCKTLESVTIPATVTSIGTYAFTGCEAITSMTVKSGNATYDSRNGCNAIIEKAGNRLIAGCKTSVIPNTVTTIGIFAFYEHNGIETIEIPSSVTKIERSAFNHILGLKRIVVPNSVVTLEPYVFSQCYGLEEVTIGSGVTSMGQGLLYGCSAVTSLTSCIMNPNTVTMGTNVFKNMDYDNCVLHVPFGSSGLYRNADQWEQFFNIVEMNNAIPGDVNGDNVVTAADITALYSIILNDDWSNAVNADQNGDGEITAADITAVYTIMLGN